MSSNIVYKQMVALQNGFWCVSSNDLVKGNFCNTGDRNILVQQQHPFFVSGQRSTVQEISVYPFSIESIFVPNLKAKQIVLMQ